MKRSVGTVAVALLLAACDAEERACTPGAAAPCACSDGRLGSQTCDEAGTGLLPCVCDEWPCAVDAAPQEDTAARDAAAPEEDATPEPPPELVVTPGALVFGAVPLGHTAYQPLTVANVGPGPLRLTHAHLVGDGAFTVSLGEAQLAPTGTRTFAEPLVVPPGDALVALVAYAPEEPGPAAASLILYSNDPVHGSVQVNLQGGLTPPCLTVEPAAVDLGVVPVGVEAARTITLRSCGGLPVAITWLGLDPAEPTPFSLDLGTLWNSGSPAPSAAHPLTLGPGQTDDVIVRYRRDGPSPTDAEGAPIPDEALLVIESNAGPLSAPLTGAAVATGKPLAFIVVDEGTAVAPQTTLHLRSDASTASTPIGRTAWSVKQPPGSHAKLEPSADAPSPTLLAHVSGTYTFTLTVWDADDQPSAPASVEVRVVPATALHVELVWHTPGDPDQTDDGPSAGADVDLHFAHPYAAGPDLDGDGAPDGWYDLPLDCFWFNRSPNWGSFDPSVDDDPSILLDDTTGARPELLRARDLPGGVTYRIGVHHYADHGYGPTYATLRVYLHGVLAWERAGVRLANHDLWEAATLEWPSGEVHTVTLPGGANKITPNYENAFFFQP